MLCIENTMLVSFDIKFIRRHQKQRKNGEACRASPTCFWSSLINLISKHTKHGFLFIMHNYKILRYKKVSKEVENKRSFV